MTTDGLEQDGEELGQNDAIKALQDRIREGLSLLGRTRDGNSTAFLALDLHDYPLESSSQLSHMVHIQNLSVKSCGLTELRSLGSMSGLTFLDVSDNALEALLDLRPAPPTLHMANLEGNRIRDATRDLSEYRMLRALLLSRNPLETIGGMEALPRLEVLALDDCLLSSLDGLLGATQLRALRCNRNRLSSLSSLSGLTRLERLEVSGNKIKTLQGLGSLESLRTLDLSDNCVGHHESLSSLRRLSQLSVLDVRNNGLCDVAEARLHTLYLLPQLTDLDGVPTSAQEKVDGANLHGADLQDLRAIRGLYFPGGELDDLGGAPPSLSTPLDAEPSSAASASPIPDDLVGRVAATVDAGGIHVAHGIQSLARTLSDIPRPSGPLPLLQCAYLWTVGAIQPPADGNTWSTAAPLLRPHLEPYERELMPDLTTSAWSERVTHLFISVLSALGIPGLEAEAVHGTIRPRTLRPGERLLMHNHCWAAVKITGHWRLIDCSLAAIPHSMWRFYTPPIEMCLTHLPLINRWQLMGTQPKTIEEFWAAPTATPAYFTLAVGSPADPSLPPSTIRPPGPLFSIIHTTPVGTALFHELLDAQMNTVKFDDSPGVPPGSHTFSHVCHSTDAQVVSPRRVDLDGAERDTWELWTSLPAPGEYYLRVSALLPSEGEEAVEVITYRVLYESRDPSPRPGPLLPNCHRQWWYSRCELHSPAPGARLYFGQTVTFAVVAPEPIARPAIGVPGGHTFTILLAEGYESLEDPLDLPDERLTFRATASLPLPDQGVSYVITAESADCPSVFAPLACFRLETEPPRGTWGPEPSVARSLNSSAHPSATSPGPPQGEPFPSGFSLSGFSGLSLGDVPSRTAT